jgi:hypothetical protein
MYAFRSRYGLSDLGEAAAVDVVTAVTEVTEDHLVLVSRILFKKHVHVIAFYPVLRLQIRNPVPL